MPARKRQGMVPDFMMLMDGHRQVLLELKTVHQGRTWYNSTTVKKRCGAIEKRASRVGPDYTAKARKADAKYNGTPKGVVGPFQARLEEFGRIEALVIGPRGSASKDVHALVDHIADVGTDLHWQSMGARSKIEARGVIRARLRRSFGICATRAAARLKISRLGIALGFGKAAAKRRADAHQNQRSMAEEYYQRFGPKAGFGGKHAW